MAGPITCKGKIHIPPEHYKGTHAQVASPEVVFGCYLVTPRFVSDAPHQDTRPVLVSTNQLPHHGDVPLFQFFVKSPGTECCVVYREKALL